MDYRSNIMVEPNNIPRLSNLSDFLSVLASTTKYDGILFSFFQNKSIDLENI